MLLLLVVIRDRFDPCSGSESEADLRSVTPSAVVKFRLTIAAGGTMNNSYFTPPLIGRRRLAICSVNWYNGQ